jgi:hypothetical protein
MQEVEANKQLVVREPHHQKVPKAMQSNTAQGRISRKLGLAEVLAGTAEDMAAGKTKRRTAVVVVHRTGDMRVRN